MQNFFDLTQNVKIEKLGLPTINTKTVSSHGGFDSDGNSQYTVDTWTFDKNTNKRHFVKEIALGGQFRPVGVSVGYNVKEHTIEDYTDISGDLEEKVFGDILKPIIAHFEKFKAKNNHTKFCYYSKRQKYFFTGRLKKAITLLKKENPLAFVQYEYCGCDVVNIFYKGKLYEFWSVDNFTDSYMQLKIK